MERRLIERVTEREPAEIRREIEAARDEVARSLLALRSEVSRRMHWREWVRRRPAPILLAAFGVGVWLGRR